MTRTSSLVVVCFPLFIAFLSRAQTKPVQQRYFQFSVVPALGTNGLNPGSYANYFSFNISSSYSASSLLLEVAGLSNLNTNGTRGLQFAGIANLTGANAFGGLTKKEKEAKLKNGFTSMLTGAQFSGVTNIVTDNIYGAQFTGGLNMGKEALVGVQVAGLFNIIYKYSFGLQLAGITNVSHQSMDGVQIAGISNYTSGQLTGVQIGMFNKAGIIEGRNSFEPSPTGWQLGLLNKADKMNGFQIGFINIGKKTQGTQIGLINIYRPGGEIGRRDGTAIGLINVGDATYEAFYSNELFLYNYELSTGNMKNGKILQSHVNVYVTNALIYSTHSFQAENKDEWALGYGIKKMKFNRSERPFMNENFFMGYGVDFLHLNERSGIIDKNFNMLTRLKYIRGFRLMPKVKTLNALYPFAMITSNFYYGSSDFKEAGLAGLKKSIGGKQVSAWLGLGAGLIFH